MDVDVLIEPRVDLERLTKVLDDLGHPGRTHTIRTWHRRQMERIWDAAAGYRPLTLEHFVPSGVGPKVEVIHELKNSLPLFSVSQKRFCSPEPEGSSESGKELWGYNHTSTNAFTGPGYFVVRASDTAGEVIFDYRQLPKGRVESWPAIVPNEARLGRFVYAGMVDYVRGISNHVCIGRAERGGKLMNAWFVLCRKDPN
jgi:hypothetical protein